jgi:starch synthase
MNVLFASSEARPFFTSGDLGEMAGTLPVALQKEEVDARVILPLYEGVDSNLRQRLRYVTNFTVPVGWGSQYCGLFDTYFDKVHFYFIDNEYYFKRDRMYGAYDDGERFAFFSRAILEAVPHLDFTPDVIHCNDWQTALAPVYLNLYYRHLDSHARIASVFTIHDLRYQGKYGPEALGVIGVGRENFHIVEFDGILNFTKAAIVMSDQINTLSPTYAHEIADSWYSHGLYDFLLGYQGKLRGILSGLDTVRYDPREDADIALKYSSSNFKRGKATCKKDLIDIFGLAKGETPVIGMVTPFDGEKGLDVLLHMADEIIKNGLRIVIAGSGFGHYEQFFGELAARHSGELAVKVGISQELASKVFAGSDMFLMPSRTEPGGLAAMRALRYGAVPIVRATGALRDIVTDAEDGVANGFTFADYSADELKDACFRARDMYADKDKWSNLVQRCMKTDNSWASRAREYAAMYDEAVKAR